MKNVTYKKRKEIIANSLAFLPAWQHQLSSIFIIYLCLFFCVICLFIYALWSPAGKGLTSWFSFVVSNCEFVTFPLVSWVRCGT